MIAPDQTRKSEFQDGGRKVYQHGNAFISACVTQFLVLDLCIFSQTVQKTIAISVLCNRMSKNQDGGNPNR